MQRLQRAIVLAYKLGLQIKTSFPRLIIEEGRFSLIADETDIVGALVITENLQPGGREWECRTNETSASLIALELFSTTLKLDAEQTIDLILAFDGLVPIVENEYHTIGRELKDLSIGLAKINHKIAQA